MACIICKRGETTPGTATVALERDGTTLVAKDVPARVCTTCGEEYVEEEAASRLLDAAEAAVAEGVQVETRRYVTA